MNKKEFLNELNKKIEIKLSLNKDAFEKNKKLEKIYNNIDKLFTHFAHIEDCYDMAKNKYREKTSDYTKDMASMRDTIEHATFNDLIEWIFIIPCDEKYDFIYYDKLEYMHIINHDTDRVLLTIQTNIRCEYLINKFNSKKIYLKELL